MDDPHCELELGQI
uniref:Uncharacterized protein n=1 Tax=Anguilla anguilla TaxID=7936 RepID=A0A0E9V4V4_ANGAN